MRLSSILTFLFLIASLAGLGCGEGPNGDVESGMAVPKGKVLIEATDETRTANYEGTKTWRVRGDGKFKAIFGYYANGNKEGKTNEIEFGGKTSLVVSMGHKGLADDTRWVSTLNIKVDQNTPGKTYDAVSISAIVSGPELKSEELQVLKGHMDTEQMLSAGELGVLTWWHSRPDRDTWIPDGAIQGLDVYIEGKKQEMKDYKNPAWVVWIKVVDG